jgi:ABC-type glycerol-3-phosphate transport system substrate-binding protein
MKRPATDLQAHLHCVVKDAKQVDAAWETVRFLSTEWYQERYCKEGLWLPSQTALLTPEAIARWCTAPVHPAGFEKIVTEYVPRFGHFLTMPVGYAKAEAILTPAMDAIWIGDSTAVEAMAVVPEANDALAAEAAR